MSKQADGGEITKTVNTSFQNGDTPEVKPREGFVAEKETKTPHEPLSMVEKFALSSAGTFKGSSISLGSAASRQSFVTPKAVVRAESMISQAHTPTRVVATDSVFSIESRKSMDTMSLASAESGMKSYRVSGMMGKGGFMADAGQAQVTTKGTISVRNALCLTFISLSAVLCGLIIFLSWSNAISANEEARATCDDSTSLLITDLHQQILNGTYQQIETYLTPPILTNDILELSLLRGDMIPDNFDINEPLLWDTQRTFYRKGVKNMAMILLHPDKLAFRSIDPLIDGGHLFWMKNNGTVCTDCIYNGTAYDPSMMYRYIMPPSFSNEPFSFSNLVFFDVIPIDLLGFQFLQNILSQPQESSGHGRVSWSDVFVKPASDNTIRLTILLGHCVYVTKPCELIVGADMNLDGIGSFVSSIRPSANTRVMILENSGLIVAATNSLVAVYGENGEVIRLQYNQLNDTILKSMGDSILNKFGNFSAVEGQGTLPSVDGITTSFARYTDNFDLKWVVVVGVIEDDFLMESRVKSEHLKEKQNEMSLMLLAYGIIILLVGIIIFEIITYQITSPLKRLKRELAEVAEFKFEEVVPSGDPEESSEAWNTRLQELSSIGHSFDIMRHNMHCFSRYIPPSVVSMIVQGHLNASLGVEPKIVTVFFSDLLNFTTIAESLPPRVLIETLGSYLDEMSRIIMDNEGTVGEFVGDGILAFWNSPYDVAEHQARACDASLVMQQVLAEARALQQDDQLVPGQGRKPQLRARMGITAGRVLHGNLGTPDRMKFGVVGDAVNTASRLESLCGYYGVGILVSQLIEKEIRGVYVLRHVDRVVVKGKKRTTDLFELICKKSESTTLIERYASEYHTIMELYWGQKFSAALNRLDAYCRQFPDDVASQLIMRRCQYYCQHPPEKSWNGVYAHYEKEGGGELDSKETETVATTLT